MEKFRELEIALQKQFIQLETNFHKLLIEKELKVVLKSGTWINDNGIGIAWLSCSSEDPSKEPLELTLDVKFNEKGILFEKGIYWSDGTLVEKLGDFEIGSRDDIDNLISEIEKNVGRIREVNLPRGLFHVIENLDKL